MPDTPTNLSIEDCSSNPFLVKISWLVGPSNHRDISTCHIHRMTFSRSSQNNSPNFEKVRQTVIIERRKSYRPFEVVHESLHVLPWTEYSFRVFIIKSLKNTIIGILTL